MDEQKCVACEAAKPKCDFYANDRKCKDCRKSLVKLARQLNAEHYKEYDRQRAMRQDRVNARLAYAKTDEGKAAHARAGRSYYAKHGKRRAATIKVGNAVRDGRLKKQPCFVCGHDDVEAHHPDYDAPLDVVWLCVAHHKELHAEFPHDAEAA